MLAQLSKTLLAVLMSRVGPDSPFALLSPVLGSEIPFERGFLENPFSTSRNTTFCPVLGLHGPFAKPSISFMHVFRQILVRNLIDNYYVVKFSALRASFPVTKSCPVLHTVSKHNLIRRSSGMAQTSFGNSFIAKSSIIFYC